MTVGNSSGSSSISSLLSGNGSELLYVGGGILLVALMMGNK